MLSRSVSGFWNMSSGAVYNLSDGLRRQSSMTPNLRLCIKKGLAKVGQVPAPRYAYYSTASWPYRKVMAYLRIHVAFVDAARVGED